MFRPKASRRKTPFFELLEQRALLSGNGLTGAYFNNVDLTDTKLARTDSQVSFDWSSGPPVSSVGSDFAVRWSGRAQVAFSEKYRFITQTAGGVRLWVDNRLIIDDWSSHALKSDSGYINLTGGKRYNVRMEYFNAGDVSPVAKLYWESPSQTKQVIPRGSLYSAAVDSTPPTTPTKVKATYVTDTAITISWSASSDPSTTVYYDVYIGKTKLGTTTDTSYTRGGRSPGTDYNFTVRAVDPSGNVSAAASKLVTTVAASAGAGGKGLAGKYYRGNAFGDFETTRTDTSINFDWSSAPVSTADGSFSIKWQGSVVPKYSETYTFYVTSADAARLFINDTLVINNWSDHSAIENRATVNLTAGLKAMIRLDYHESAGHSNGVTQLSWSSLSQAKQIIPKSQLFPLFADLDTPTAPSGLTATNITDTTITLAWNASTDDVGVASYDVYRDNQKIATVETPGFTDTGLSPSTSYSYKLIANDGASHQSGFSASQGVTTDPSSSNHDGLSNIGATDYDSSSGVSKSGSNVTSFDSGDWIEFNNVDFHSGVNSVRFTVALPTNSVGGSIELHLDSVSGTRIGTLVVQPTGSFSTYFNQLTEVGGTSGVHNLFLVAKNRSTVANLQSLQFSTKSLIKIMPLGDSITQEFTGTPSWRYYLYQSLRNAGEMVDFVGGQTQATDGFPPNLDFDQNHEGHSGWRTDEILAQLNNYLSANTPDVVLIHLGTNDLRANRTPQSAIDNLGTIIDTIRNFNPNVKILVATIIDCIDAPAGSVDAFNALVPGLVSSKNTGQSPVRLVDQHSGFDLNTDSDDGIHPNNTGDQLFGTKWFNAIEQLL